ncbi:MAG: helix-turn-helix domain-containing protein [Verrucomicrobiales bacterium]|jgi:transcriptional regulator with XRE-family HTH domain|nr:helix-turn-helix domain-containing protein [Verrucomicrobiales bacterium]MDR1304385.1 helix-turn-helix domain-containing protein [Verrucomicrobiales bacterium]
MSKSSENPTKTFGQNLYHLRNQAALTQEQLAERANISRRFLQEIEAGQKNPTIPLAARLRAALQCSWETLLRGL